jgi:two-component system OmpR family sensor kinase
VRTRLRRLSARTPLRVKLIAATLALLAFALALVGVGSVSVLRGYLVDRVDERINLIGAEVMRKLQRGPAARTNLRLAPDAMVQLRGEHGEVLLMMSGADVENRPPPKVPAWVEPSPSTVPAAGKGGGQWRVKVFSMGRGSFVVAVDLAEVQQITGRLALIELLGGGGVMLILASVGIVIVRRSLRPLVEIERTAEAIAAGDLSRRVPDGDPRTEVGSLARSLNGMLAQIETAFQARSRSEMAARRSEERMRRFVADASHELRTPLTSIRGFAEFYRQVPEGDAGRLMRRIEDEAMRMGVLVDDLLLLARLDRQRPIDMGPVDLLALAADAVHDARILAPGREVTLTVDGSVLIVTGDEVRLRQVIGNLMANALTHTPPEAPIEIRVGRCKEADDLACVEVVDAGPGLSPQQTERVFERFYRGDSARTRRSSDDHGSGLGLAIVAALVEAHGGTVSVDSEPGKGATFRVVLPLSPEPAA